MKNVFVTYEQALALKELGFDEPCIAKFVKKQFSMNVAGNWYRHNSDEITKGWLSAPLIQDVKKWFLYNYGLEGNIKSWKSQKGIVWHYSINKVGEPSVYRSTDCEVLTPEEAEDKLIDKLIETVKNGTI